MYEPCHRDVTAALTDEQAAQGLSYQDYVVDSHP